MTWSVLTGSGSISSGLYSPAYASGSATLQAVSGGVAATAGVTISGQAQWNSAGGGSWSTSGDWVDSISQSVIAAPGVRSIAGDTALFGATTASTITLDGASPSLAGITFNSGSEGYTIGQGTGGTLHLNNGGNSASIAVSGGSQEISAPLALDSSVLVAPVAGSRLGISGSVSGPGSSLTLNGSGTLVLGGVNSYSGGTRVSAGTLIVTESTAIYADTNLTVGAGGTFIFDPSITASNAGGVASNDTASASDAATAASNAASVASAAATAAVSVVSTDTSATAAATMTASAASSAAVPLVATVASTSPAAVASGTTVLATAAAASQPAEASFAAARRAMSWIDWPSRNPSAAGQQAAGAVTGLVQDLSSAGGNDTVNYRLTAPASSRPAAQDAVFGANFGAVTQRSGAGRTQGLPPDVESQISGQAVDLVLTQPWNGLGGDPT